MSFDSYFVTEESADVIFEADIDTISEESPDEECSSLNIQIPEENKKKVLYHEGSYDPGSGEKCAMYIAQSNSAVLQHPLYNYPAIGDPGIERALLQPIDRVLYPDDGQAQYLATCKEMNQYPVRKFHKGLLENEIDLSYNGINSTGVRAMATALRYNRFVKKLNFMDNFLSTDACFHLGQMLISNIKIVELNLSGCRIGPAGLNFLLDGITMNCALRILNLDRNQLGDSGGDLLAEAFINGVDVEDFGLSFNDISSQTLKAFIHSFKTENNIRKLDLSWNNLFSSSMDVKKFLSALSENKSLEELNLSWTALSGEKVGVGIKRLLLAPYLTYLNISNNNLSDQDVVLFADNLEKAQRLLILDLSYNPLTALGASKLINQMNLDTVNLQQLLMNNVDVDPAFMQILEEVLASKPKATVTFGRVITPFTPKCPDMRDIILNRIDFLLKKPRRHKLDIALIVLKQLKDNVENMPSKMFSRLIKGLGGNLDKDLIAGLVENFSDSHSSKHELISMNLLAEYVRRKWPERQLPPTPPPEPEIKDKKKRKKSSLKAKKGVKTKNSGKGKKTVKSKKKRWQRRWFVLYDDGELTYSLDEHPDTVPQASIDMTQVLEVSEADSVTGHQFSLAVTAPDRVTFVKGTCREEARWWADVLSVYPRSKGRHKRNATFPGGQTASLLSTTTARKYSADASTLRDVADGCSPTRRYGSCAGTTTWPGPRVQPPQPEIPTLTAPATIDTKVYTDQPVSSASPPTRDKINGEEKARSRRRDTWADSSTTPANDDGNVRSPLLQQQHQQYDEQLRDIAASLTRPRSRRALPPTLERPTRLPPPDRLSARGSPDGGVPPEEGTSSSASEGSEPADITEAPENNEGGRVELPAERLLHARAGWLQRRGPAGWSRHWFVLRGAALLYFRDPHAEHRGLMDGVIDLSGVARVVELPTSASTNGYAFETETWDGKHIVLSAVTAGIRANWVSAIRRTAGLPDTAPLSLVLREDSIDQASESSTSPVTPVTPLTGRSAPFSSDEEYRTASEGGRRDSADWGDVAPQPPPSPILNRTPISKVKEKVRARGCHQVPPRSDAPKGEKDEIDATKEKECPPEGIDENEKQSEPRKRSYMSTIDKQSIEIEDLRKQLKLALGDVTAAESELARLRKLKSDAGQREKKMEELVITLQKKEEELSQRTKESENLDAIKQLYSQDKTMWEKKLTETQNFLKESTEHCEHLTRQLTTAQETVMQLQRELNELNDKLIKSVKENDNLYSRIRELEGRIVVESPTKEKRKSIGSLSDLAHLNKDLNLESLDKNMLVEEYVELRSRFLKAIQEIKSMKKELRDSHNVYDELEITNMKLRNEMKLREQCSRSEIDLLAARILDLTQKLTASDKQVRTLKHKIQKTESREKRRSLSLKGRESFTLGKEVEEKLSELESKITQLETGAAPPTINPPSKSSSPAKEKNSKTDSLSDEKRMKRLAARLRRKSLDSATSSEPMKMLVRLTSLETKVASALENRRDFTNSCESLSVATRSSESPGPDSASSGGVGTQAQRHLLDRLQSLETVVIHSREKVNECLCQMSAMRAAKSRRSPSPSLDKKYSIKSMEKCLTEVSERLQECFDKCVVDCGRRAAAAGAAGAGAGAGAGAEEEREAEEAEAHDGVAQLVVELEEQLRGKLLEVSSRKAALYEAGQLTRRRSLELLAEKLAYEAVLVTRIQEALDSSDGSRFFARLIKSEIYETSQLIDNLKRKLNGDGGRAAGSRSSLDYLARILSRKIDAREAGEGGGGRGARRAELSVRSRELEALRASQREVADAVERFKTRKLAELAAALAHEAPAADPAGEADGDAGGDGSEARVRSAWAAARATLGAELVQAEVSRALARAAQGSELQLWGGGRARLTLSAQDRADLELWWRAAHDHLRCELDLAARDIARRYRECAAAGEAADAAGAAEEGEGGEADSRAVLQQLAEVLAHKALVDARLAVVEGTYRASSPSHVAHSSPAPPDDPLSSLDVDPRDEAEFVYLFQHFSDECRALFSTDCSGNSEDLTKISDSLERVEAAVAAMRRDLGGGEEAETEAGEAEGEGGVVGRVEALRGRVEALRAQLPCRHCQQLQEALDRVSEERSRDAAALAAQAGALAAARRARSQLTSQHERERAQLRERARRLERRLAALDSEYSAQLDSLRAAYQSAVSADAHGDGLRARYQQEIEQLRALCEKGLMAMESSHRRIVREMEEKHRAEREQLRLDKEQALAEETRATLAALDAMRKAHESEVRREVDKFKAEFLSRGAMVPDLSQLSTRHQQEMEEIKREILSLSEKYSIKCVESAALEERLQASAHKLAQAQHHIMQLDSRNKQLRAHLISEANDMKNCESSSLSQLIEENTPAKSSRASPLLEAARPSRPAKIQFAKTESTRNLQLSPVQN